MAVRQLPDDTALLREEYEAALLRFFQAATAYREMSEGDAEDPRQVLRRDMACAEAKAAEANLRAVIHDARALGVRTTPAIDLRELPLVTLIGWAAWIVMSWSVVGIAVLRGLQQLVALGVLVVVAIAVLTWEGLRQ